MVASSIVYGDTAKKINLFCLLLAIAIVLVLPLKKEIWYDESISVMCSKGISHDTHLLFDSAKVISSSALQQLNNDREVFNATINDNANSFVYNIGLHWFTLLFGNSLTAHTLFSKLLAVVALIAFFSLSNLFFNGSVFTSLAVLLLATDNNFIGMAHEVRAYVMGIMFVTLAAMYLFRYIYQQEKAVYLFLTSLFSVGAILSHFLSVYIIIALLLVLFITKKASVFSVRNSIAILLPLLPLGLFFMFAYPGLQTMSIQNHHIQERTLSTGFSLLEVALRSVRFTTINFKLVFPAFNESVPVLILSFVLFITCYLYSVNASGSKEDTRKLHLLFIAGISGTLFLAFLSIKAHHYTSLYFRYFSFGTPFCSLFVAWLLYTVVRSARVNAALKTGIFFLFTLPVAVLFFSAALRSNPKVRYNHNRVAAEIARQGIARIAVPEWEDAFLVQCFLPNGYKIDYVLNPASRNFTLYKGITEESVPVIKEHS